MTLRALFDKDRRGEIQRALARGEAIPFRIRAPKQEEPAQSAASANRYEGRLDIGTPLAVGGFEFVYNGVVEDGLAMGIRSREGIMETKTLSGGRESVFDYEADGKRVRVTPHKNCMSWTDITIVVEDMFAEND